jgi:hypothetical protein
MHISMDISIDPWAFKMIEKLMRGFLWCGMEVASGGKCAVARVNTSCPILFNLVVWESPTSLSWVWRFT